MSNDVSIFRNKNAVGVSSERRLTKLGQSIASTSINRRIQTNVNGTFKKLVNGEQIGNAVRGEMNVIIINLLPSVSRVYYASKYDPNAEATLPNCWSNLGDAPEDNVPDAMHSNCADCDMNVKGSGQNGGKACRYQRRIAVLLEGDTTGDVYQFNVPAKSIFGKGVGNEHPFESYMKFLTANGESPDTVVTAIRYDDDADSMELLFSPVRQVTDQEFELVQQAQNKRESDKYVRITVAQLDGVTKLPVKEEKPVEAPKPKVQRSEDPDDDDTQAEEVAEPKKRAKSAKSETVAVVQSNESLASALGEWGAQ
jgi:hypothetical protein